MSMRNRLFIETDDSCAICGARGPYLLTVHHIDGDHSNNTYDNQIVLCHNCHQTHHQTEGLPKAKIMERKKRLIEKTLTRYGINAMRIASRSDAGIVAAPFLLYHLVEFGYMSQTDVLSTWSTEHSNDVPVDAVFDITLQGKDLLARWFE